MKFERRQNIAAALEPKRVLIVYGPRRVGKTTMLKAYLQTQQEKKLFYAVGDDARVRDVFKGEYRKEILDLFLPYEIIALDEAQHIPSIGLGAKMLIDAFPEKHIILTGSSSFNLSRIAGEPLTGRHFTLTLLPIAQSEIAEGRFELQNALEDFLVYGAYPEILLESEHERKKKILTELVSSYLFKDVLALGVIKNPDMVGNVLKCLAFQLGNEVSLNEIAKTVGSDVKTVSRYLDLLEKMFIIRKVSGFSRNLRNEISQKAKYYFLDNGIRNAVIAQFNPLSLRNDIGALFENFIFMELVKRSGIEGAFDRYYFWRTHEGKEIDIIKESEGKLAALECKWARDDVSAPRAWKEAYPDSSFAVIHPGNYLDFVL